MTRTTRRGRPPGTDNRRLEVVALELFATHGFERTTVEQIAAAAGVSRRTFFRYYDSKSAVLWHGFEREVEAIHLALDRIPADVPVRTAIRRAVLDVNRARAEDEAALRRRMRLLTTAPEPAGAERRYHAWERAISEFAADRIDVPADSLVAVTIGRVTLAACRAAYDHWATAHESGSLIDYLDTALRILETGSVEREQLTPGNPQN